jgi:predicted  nucleic acid-binding Zn-ribbon protein
MRFSNLLLLCNFLFSLLWAVGCCVQEEVDKAARSESDARTRLAAALARAEAAEKKVEQLEREADGLAKEVGMLQVSVRAGRGNSKQKREVEMGRKEKRASERKSLQ